MARIAQVFIAVATALTLCGCAAAPLQTRPFWTLHAADFNQLRPGMTMAEAERIVGKPLLATHFPRLAEQVWEYEFLDTQTRMKALVHFGDLGTFKYHTVAFDQGYYSGGPGNR